MAKTVRIRGVPDDVYRALEGLAAASGRSLSEYLLSEITRIAERPVASEVLRRADARGGGVSIEEIVRAVRSGRGEI
jgi:antitoxin FitA